MNEEIIEIGRSIKTIREKQKISKRQLANLIETSAAAIAETENGKRNSSITVLSRIAKALNCQLVIGFKKNKSK